MLRFLTDEDFDGRLTSALLTRIPDLNLVRVQDAGLMNVPDPDILAWGPQRAESYYRTIAIL
jgi:hypothetical protein